MFLTFHWTLHIPLYRKHMHSYTDHGYIFSKNTEIISHNRDFMESKTIIPNHGPLQKILSANHWSILIIIYWKRLSNFSQVLQTRCYHNYLPTYFTIPMGKHIQILKAFFSLNFLSVSLKYKTKYKIYIFNIRCFLDYTLWG